MKPGTIAASEPVSAFDRALEQTLDLEGGESNHPDDRGGHTFHGFTQELYDAWRKKSGLDTRPVTQITRAEERRIALEEFWLPCKCDQLPDALALAVFDMAFHSSPHDAAIALQESLQVKADGAIGPKTVAAARAAGPVGVLYFLKRRGAEMVDIWKRDRSQLVSFGEGWINRLLDQAWSASR